MTMRNSNSKYTIHVSRSLGPLQPPLNGSGSIRLCLEIDDFVSANFAFNALLGTVPEKGVEYTYTMYLYDFVSESAASYGRNGLKTTTVIKCVKMLDGVEVV